MGVIPAENMDLECFVAIRASDVRIKLRCTFHSVLTCSQYVRVALYITSRLQLDYVDLYLIHNPKGKNVARYARDRERIRRRAAHGTLASTVDRDPSN